MLPNSKKNSHKHRPQLRKVYAFRHKLLQQIEPNDARQGYQYREKVILASIKLKFKIGFLAKSLSNS